MKKPEDRLPESYCRNCGARLDVRKLSRPRVGGVFGQRQSQADTVCSGCGTVGGVSWTILVSRHPPRNPLVRLLFRLRQLRLRRQYARLTDSLRTRNLFVGDDGRMNLARLVAAAPFPVYGLKGRPMGLRLRSPGWGSKGTPTGINSTHLGYVAGHPNEPEKAVDIRQVFDVNEDAAAEDLSSVLQLVYNYSSKEHREAYFDQGGMHRDWNLKRLQNTPRQQATIQAGGMNVDVQFTSWDKPQRVILARMTIEEHSLIVASLNASWPELQEALSTLVVLQEDQEALADHQQDRDEVSRQLYEHHDK